MESFQVIHRNGKHHHPVVPSPVPSSFLSDATTTDDSDTASPCNDLLKRRSLSNDDETDELSSVEISSQQQKVEDIASSSSVITTTLQSFPNLTTPTLTTTTTTASVLNHRRHHHHVHYKRIAMFYWDCSQPFKWGCDRSLIIGLSSFFYLTPSLVLRRHVLWESNLWLLVTLCSFLSDYLFVGQRHSPFVRGIHLMDRWVASFSLATQVFYNVPMWFSVGFLLGISGALLCICAILTKMKGTNALTVSDFTFWHVQWHVVGGFGRTFQAWLQFYSRAY